MDLLVWFHCAHIIVDVDRRPCFCHNSKSFDKNCLLIIPQVPSDVLRHQKFVYRIQRGILECLKRQAWIKSFKAPRCLILPNCTFTYNWKRSRTIFYQPFDINHLNNMPLLKAETAIDGRNEVELFVVVNIRQRKPLPLAYRSLVRPLIR